MIKHPKKRYQKLFATAHRYFVYASIAFTAATTAFIGVSFYQHFKNRKAVTAGSTPVPQEVSDPEILEDKPKT